MPSLYTSKSLRKPWHARTKRDGLEFSLGYFETYEEALAVEMYFASKYPPRRSTLASMLLSKSTRNDEVKENDDVASV